MTVEELVLKLLAMPFELEVSMYSQGDRQHSDPETVEIMPPADGEPAFVLITGT